MPDSDRQHAGDERSSNILLSLSASHNGDSSGVMVVMLMLMMLMMPGVNVPRGLTVAVGLRGRSPPGCEAGVRGAGGRGAHGAAGALLAGFYFLECMPFIHLHLFILPGKGGPFSISFHKLHFPAGVC